ncbi:hypothetical protein MCL36_09080 [Acinetobacter pittii]|uniref:hypothetical protein n=1 Tax=Acinetobacter pittii TaxID=48296 RepID=UPI001EFDDA33|nr:hypothetical protein [Acinetobacter pittii]MCG9492681.1 hypothetical protein [Acinetobacter pittii]
MKNLLVMGLLGSVLAGCAVTYTPPETIQTNVLLKKPIDAKKDALIKAAQKTLTLNGEQIQNIDTNSGIITTVPKTLRLNPDLADCGKTMGLDYLKDNRTNSKFSYNIIIEDNSLTIKGNPTAEYRVGASDQDMNLTCVSKGVLENQLFESIKNNL